MVRVAKLRGINLHRSLWADYGTMVLKSAVLLMAIAAVIWLGYEFWRLIWQSGEMGAIDLRQRHDEIQAWFAGKPVYGDIVTAVYPPASYAILWPLIGWLTVTAARWFWAVTTAIALMWTVFLCVRESGAHTLFAANFCRVDAALDVRHRRNHRKWATPRAYSAGSGGWIASAEKSGT